MICGECIAAMISVDDVIKLCQYQEQIIAADVFLSPPVKSNKNSNWLMMNAHFNNKVLWAFQQQIPRHN